MKKNAKMKKPVSVEKSLSQKIYDRLNDCRYDVEYDYDRDSSGCQCYDYCRCSRIVNTKIISINIESIILGITDFTKNEFLKYCIDRILSIGDINNLSNWEVNICNGYYGEEANGVSLDRNIINNICQKIDEIEKLSDIDKIKKVLEEEYGYLLDVIKPMTSAKIEVIKTSEINFPNDVYVKKLDIKRIDRYKDYLFPRGIVLKNGTNLRLIDGYHRLTSAKKNNIENIEVIILE